jgi:exodeoxyribonuclease-5
MQWSPQQDAALLAVKAWLRDPRAPQVFRLFGWAGTGKSTLAQYLAEDAGHVVFAAFTGKAALVMQKRGCVGASTIHSLIYRIKEEKGGEPEWELNHESAVLEADLVVIDEVSMVNEDLAKDLLSFNRKVLVLGDPFQLPPVKGAGFFTEAEPDIMLTEIHRQAADNPIIRMSIEIREGRGLDWGTYGDSKVIHPSDVSRDEVLAASQIIVGLNRTRVTYNDRIRALKELPRRMPVPGDRLVCLRNNRTNGLLNGQLWEAVQVKRQGRAVLKMLLKPDDAGAKVNDLMVTSHEYFFNGREEELPRHERRRFDEFYFGYCLTAHKAQGSQWEDVFLFNESASFREMAPRWLYTGLTRASDRITVVQ